MEAGSINRASEPISIVASTSWGKMAEWEGDKQIPQADVDARRADLAKLEKEREALSSHPTPSQGSFFRYRIEEVRDTLGKEPAVTEQMLAYYKIVNERNKAAFADRKPRPPSPSEPSYVGVEKPARTATRMRARSPTRPTRMPTRRWREFQGGKPRLRELPRDRLRQARRKHRVTHVAELEENVQCEVCHGPGSQHAAKPNKVKMPIEKPKPEACLACHHPPHVHAFDARRKMADILGPGHGKPTE